MKDTVIRGHDMGDSGVTRGRSKGSIWPKHKVSQYIFMKFSKN